MEARHGMTLTTLDRIGQLFVCPRCRFALEAEGATFRCTSTTCVYGAPGAFPVLGRWPLLIDSERSVVRGADLLSVGDPVKSLLGGGTRRNAVDRAPPMVRALWRPPNRVAARNTERLLRLLPGPAPKLLVVGGGTVGNGVEAIYADPRVQVIGFDIFASPLTQFIADAHHIPLADGTVDAVVVQAVLEHVLAPDKVVAEIHRVLRPGGLVYAETPFLQQVHAGAYDFTRYTTSGHRYLFRNFEEISAGAVAGPGTELLWSIDHLVRGLSRSSLAGRLVRGLLFWLRYLDAAIPPDYAEDNASALYFLGRRSGREMSPREIVEYYRGAQTCLDRRSRRANM